MRLSALTLVAILLTAGAALAQDPAPEPRHRADPEERERFEARLHLMRMVALTEALALDEATAAKLFPYLREGDEAQGAVHGEIREHRKALKAMAESNVFDDATIDEHIEALGTLEQRMAALRAEQVAGLKRILTAEQRVKFLLTRAHLERELRQVLRDHRQGERRERRERGVERWRGDVE